MIDMNHNHFIAKFDVLMHVSGRNCAQLYRILEKSIENEVFVNQYVSRENTRTAPHFHRGGRGAPQAGDEATNG